MILYFCRTAKGGRVRNLGQTIYIDILFCVNFVIDYIILLTVKKFMSLSCKRRRLFLGAAVGGVSSFIILLPPISSGLSMVVSFLTACVVVAVSFAPLERIRFIKTASSFFLISFGYCGAMIAVWILFSPENIVIRNSSVYIAMSPLTLIITTLVCYVILRVIMRITGRGNMGDTDCIVKIKYNNTEISCRGKLDTGNSLKEPFSGDMAIVVKQEIFKDFPELENIELSGEMPKGIRMIPYSSVGGEGVMAGFRADNICIEISKRRFDVSAYIALCKNGRIVGETDALVPAELIP